MVPFSGYRVTSGILSGLVAVLIFSMSWSVAAALSSPLQYGDRGQQVSDLQRALAALGYFDHEVTEYFGSVTQDAVIKFQTANNISPAAGYFGPLTLAKLKSGASPSGGAVVGASSTQSSAKITTDALNALSTRSSFSMPGPVGTKIHGPWEDPSLHCAPYNLIAVSSHTGEVIYIASSYDQRDSGRLIPDTNNCGVYKSTDGGQTFWAADGSRDSELPKLFTSESYWPITALAVAPSNPDIVYAGSPAAGGRLYQSLDAGKTWKNISAGEEPSQITSIAIDSTDPTTVYVGSSGGMYQGSYDSATHTIGWDKIKSGYNNELFFVVMDPTNAKTIYAYTLSSTSGSVPLFKKEGTWFSLDFGSATSNLYKGTYQSGTWGWKTLSVPGTPIIRDLAIDPFSSNTAYISTTPAVFQGAGFPISAGSSGILKTITNGDNWFFVKKNQFTSVVADPEVRNVAYTVRYADTIFGPFAIDYTPDGGGTWTQLQTPDTAQLSSIADPFHFGPQIYVNGAKRVLYAPTVDGIYVIKLDQAGGTSPSPTSQPQLQTLDVSLSANPSSVIAGQNVSLTANVSGTAQGTIHYQFDCTNNGGYEVDVVNTIDPYTTNSCSYPSPGIYTAKVHVERGTAAPTEATASITVGTHASPTPKLAPAACSFTRDLSQEVSGNDVLCLQRYLNSSGFIIAASGPGSPGNETNYFGPLMSKAISKWQTTNNISPASGNFGAVSRAKFGAAPVPSPTSCVPNWQCNSWNICSSGQQTRTCTDSSNCGVSTNKPASTQSCSQTTTPTPAPTPIVLPQNPDLTKPSCNLPISKSHILPGQKTTIYWQVKNVTHGVLSNGATMDTVSDGTGKSGSFGDVAPTETTTYSATFTGPNGTCNASATVTIESVQPAGKLQLSVNPYAITPSQVPPQPDAVDPFILITATQGHTSLVLEAHWFTQNGGITEIITQPDGSTYTLHHTMIDVRYGESINTATASLSGTYTIQFVDDTTGQKSNAVRFSITNNTDTAVVTYDYPESLDPQKSFNVLVHQIRKTDGVEVPIMYSYRPDGSSYSLSSIEYLIAEAKHNGWKYEVMPTGQ